MDELCIKMAGIFIEMDEFCIKMAGLCTDTESTSSKRTERERRKARGDLHEQLREQLLTELYAADLPAVNATGDAIEDGKLR